MRQNMRLHEITKIDEIGLDIARDILKSLGKAVRRKSQSQIDKIKKEPKRDNQTGRTGGSDDYDYIIKKYK